jgi:hypothetical protein
VVTDDRAGGQSRPSSRFVMATRAAIDRNPAVTVTGNLTATGRDC